MAIEDLADSISSVVATNGSSISVRDDAGVFLFVNDAWLRDFKTSPVGKTLAETALVSADEVAASQAVDDEVKRKGAIVEVIRANVNQKSLKMLLIRVYLRYQGAKYLVVISMLLTNTVDIPTPFGWSADRASRVMGENIANRLQMLDEAFTASLNKAAVDLQTLVEAVRKALKESEK